MGGRRVGVLEVDTAGRRNDETKLHDRQAVMMVGLAWEGRCLPLAWRTYYRANDSEAYPAEGQVGMIATLLAQVQAGLPTDCRVLVLADRGIGTSPELCRAVESLGWHALSVSGYLPDQNHDQHRRVHYRSASPARRDMGCQGGRSSNSVGAFLLMHELYGALAITNPGLW